MPPSNINSNHFLFFVCNPKCTTARYKRGFQVVITLFYAFYLHAATASGVIGTEGLSHAEKIGISAVGIIVAILGIIVTVCIAVVKKRK